ncbi:extracellular solute-binding protein [Paenibacillus rigui]|uniref:GntR family transcriptional regulator n=1 Tax=Paenibacillus rigui TaxID=554312 RepID=A0A229UV35_9BACL|nr:extracellular solute-binding protein [Paenibacillus rigui]OXM87111.1 GntR family transcriptional regulator [Paenibacillus rigui]
MKKRISRKHFRLRLDEMVATLRHEIISGKLAVGSYLPSESDLEQRFELSNASVRNGLKVLVDEGLIEKIARVGNRVTCPAPDQGTVIKFGYVHDIADLVEMDTLLAEFGRQHPHIQVQPVELPSGSYSKTLQDYMQSEILDVVLMNNNNFQDFVENGCTELLERIEPVEDCSTFLNKPFQQGDGLCVRPFIYSPVVLCYNRKHFEQANVPVPDSSWTWRELLQYGRQLAVKNEHFGFYFYLPSRNRWPIFMLQSGEAFQADAEGQYHLQSRGRLLGSLETCKDLLEMTDVFPRILSESDADAEALFVKGKVSVIMTTYYFLNQLRQSDIVFDVSPLPGLQDSSTLLIVNGLAISSRSSNKDAARLFVDFMTGYETQLLIRRRTLNITASRRAMEWDGEESIYRPSRFYMYREIFPTLRLITELGLSNAQLKAIQRDIMLFLSGLQDGEDLREQLESVLSQVSQA